MYDLSFHDLDSKIKYKEMQVYPASIYSQISIIETKKSACRSCGFLSHYPPFLTNYSQTSWEILHNIS